MRILAAIAVVAAMLVPVRAPAAPSAVVIATAFTFAPGGEDILGGAAPGSSGPLIVPRGTDVLFVSAELLAPEPHTMTADGCLAADPDPCWFDTGDPRPQAPGETAIVPTAFLPDGVYGFFCAVHDVMRGTLVVA